MSADTIIRALKASRIFPERTCTSQGCVLQFEGEKRASARTERITSRGTGFGLNWRTECRRGPRGRTRRRRRPVLVYIDSLAQIPAALRNDWALAVLIKIHLRLHGRNHHLDRRRVIRPTTN